MGPIVVLGMHRSGTSALAQALARAGMEAPPDEFALPGDEHNPHGYFEDARVVEVDDWILAQHGGGYMNPWPLRGVEPATTELERVATLWSDLGPCPRLVVKDPRLCVTLRWWLPVWADTARFAIIVRHPTQVAASLAARDGIPTVLAELLWLEHTRQAIVGTAGRRRTLVRYDDLLAGEGATVRRVLERLELRDAAGGLPATWSGRVDPALARQRDTAEPQLASVRALWNQLSGVDDGVVPELSADSGADDRADAAILGAALGAAVDRHRADRVHWAQIAQAKDHADRELDAAQRLLAAIQQSRSWRWTSAVRRLGVGRVFGQVRRA